MPSAAVGRMDGQLRARTAAAYRSGRGTVVSLPIPARRSNVHTGPALVYLPPQYGDPTYANRSFPVLELLDGFPGSPRTWTRTLHIASVMDSLIADGRAAPFLVVMPIQNVASPRDTECVDVPRGPQVDSYLTYDVRTAMQQAFRASGSGHQWTVMGDSTGGYCAADLSLQHPGMFNASVSIAGYNAPAHDATTGNLFGSRPGTARFYSPIWLIRQHSTGPLHLLLISTEKDLTAYRAARELASAARPPLQLSTLTLPWGGHNFGTFSAELPTALGWLSQWVAAPLAPVPAVDGLVPTAGGPISPTVSGTAGQAITSQPSRHDRIRGCSAGAEHAALRPSTVRCGRPVPPARRRR